MSEVTIYKDSGTSATRGEAKAVGTKVLKDNLSKFLKMVRAGETIWVTDRDEGCATGGPPAGSPVGEEWAAHRIDVLEQYFGGINFKIIRFEFKLLPDIP